MKPKYHIEKITSKRNPSHGENLTKWSYKGNIYFQPKVGERFMLSAESGDFYTTFVMCVYVHDQDATTGTDKLILPPKFPIEDIPNDLEINKGDTLFTTMNSIYILREINKAMEG